MIGLAMQAAILFLVVGGLLYNAFGIRDWWSRGVAHAVTHSVQQHDHSTPRPTATH